MRGTVRSFRQVAGARELILEGLVTVCSQPWGRVRRVGQVSYVVMPPPCTTEEIRRALQEPGWTWLDSHELRFGKIGLLALGAVVLAFGALAAFGPLLASRAPPVVWTIIIWPSFACMVIVLLNLPNLIWMARYVPARLLVRRRRGEEAEPLTAPPPGPAVALPPGMGAKLRVLSIGSLISAALMLFGVWRLGNNAIFTVAEGLLAALAVALPANLGAWPALFRLGANLQWRGWETVMEDPKRNWFDTLTVCWLALGLLLMAVPYALLRFWIVIIPSSVKYSLFHIVVTFVLQGLLFAYARSAMQQKGTAYFFSLPSREELSRSAKKYAVPFCSFLGLIAFFIAFPKLPTVRLLREIAVPSGAINALAISADGKRALTGEWDGTVRLWNLETGAEIRRLGVLPGGAERVAFSQDGLWALAAHGVKGDGIWLWDLNAGQETRLPEEDWFCPPVNGAQILTRFQQKNGESWETTLVVRQLATGALIHRFEPVPSYPMGAAVLSDDGRQMLTAYANDEEAGVRHWDVGTGQELHCWRFEAATLKAFVSTVAFIQGGHQAMAVDTQGTLRFWDTDSGQQIRMLRRLDEPAVHWHGFGTTAFAGGRYAATIAFDRDFRIYDLEQGELVYTGDLPHEHARFLAGSADGRRLLTCGWHGGLFVWEL
jgi:WD40 repeat protein